LIVGHRDIYFAKKILNSFVCVEIGILVEKLNVFEGHSFPEAITKNMQIGNVFLVFKYPVICKQKISKSSFIFLKLM
jgi:hypothetical protein